MTKKNLILSIAGAAIVCGGILWTCNGGSSQTSALEYETAKVERATIASSVTATGTIEPVTKVEVGTQVSGIISKIYVDYNSVVKKGQVIAELDKTNLTSELNSARSNLAASK